ncbi:peptidoglycan-binding protein [Sporolactobacillus sp. THM7-7]|nr:peptidoglycan-binding protein [Sporolactobacillus sp. THM7-7]
MNIIKRLTGVTCLTVFLGVLAPTTIAFAKTSSTNDSHIVKPDEQSDEPSDAVGFAGYPSSTRSEHIDNTETLGDSLLRPGDAGDFVAQLQDELRELGYYSGDINGIFGTTTVDAVLFFQKSMNISEKGVVGPETKTVLYDLYRHSSEAKAYQEKAAQIEAEEAEKEKERRLAAKKAEKARKAAREAQIAAAEKEAAEQAAREKAEKLSSEQAADSENKPAVKNADTARETETMPAPPSSGSKTITVEATSYALGGTTATGVDLTRNPDAKVIAVDPNVIPLGSKVLIPGYGTYTAADTGGKIKGHRIDLHLPTKEEAINFGRRTLQIQILN